MYRNVNANVIVYILQSSHKQKTTHKDTHPHKPENYHTPRRGKKTRSQGASTKEPHREVTRQDTPPRNRPRRLDPQPLPDRRGVIRKVSTPRASLVVPWTDAPRRLKLVITNGDADIESLRKSPRLPQHPNPYLSPPPISNPTLTAGQETS
ncbi:Hypothetical predicted protein [Pelobates cultripes]|uniref:Uncharacterized protein n=1 Tax=Pelobates cultripes TaxID=61616 RepID=A0AAD1R429_PELCU|nr:Hypothetical predicted protein [Pelobates cultripes]